MEQAGHAGAGCCSRVRSGLPQSSLTPLQPTWDGPPAPPTYLPPSGPSGHPQTQLSLLTLSSKYIGPSFAFNSQVATFLILPSIKDCLPNPDHDIVLALSDKLTSNLHSFTMRFLKPKQKNDESYILTR